MGGGVGGGMDGGMEEEKEEEIQENGRRNGADAGDATESCFTIRATASSHHTHRLVLMSVTEVLTL